MNIFNKTA